MPTALLDTNAVSDLMRGHQPIRTRVVQHVDPIVTSAIVIGEIIYGLSRMHPGKKRNDLEGRASGILAALPIEHVTERTARGYGSLKASLESQGLAVDDNDLWIAATALTLGAHVLVTRDRVFRQIPGLHVADWSV